MGSSLVCRFHHVAYRRSIGICRREDAYRHNNLGVAHLERYDFRAATDAFRQALTIEPNLTIARLNLAIARLYDGDHDGASIDANAVVAALPQSPHGHYVAGLIARAANRTADAAAAFQRTLDIDPEDVGTRIQLAQIHTAERRYAEATSLFDAALAREPFNATAAYGLATALVRAGQRAAGEAAMARFQALRDNPAAVTYSNNYLEQGRYGEALASTGLEVELVDPAAPAAHFVDATAAMFGESDPHGRVALFDADRDGDLDGVLASASGLALLINDEGRFARRRSIASMGDGVGAVGGDYDNDGRPDIFVIGRAGNRLFRQQPDGSFNAVRVNAEDPPSATAGQAGVTGDTATAALADIDHDGDLDLFSHRRTGCCATTATARSAKRPPPPDWLARYRSQRSSRRTTTIAATSTCFLSRRAERLRLFANRRDGTFHDVAASGRSSRRRGVHSRSDRRSQQGRRVRLRIRDVERAGDPRTKHRPRTILARSRPGRHCKCDGRAIV